MALARTEYARLLVEDALIVSSDPTVISAIVLSDSLNGIRKAILDLSESNRQIADELSVLVHTAKSQ
jgi:hypothetical protein